MRYTKEMKNLAVCLALACVVTILTPFDASAAGVTTLLQNQQNQKSATTGNATGAISGVSAVIAQTMTLVSSAEPTEVDTEVTEVAEASPWANRLMTTVSDEMNIRDSASESGEIVGYLRSGDIADIIALVGDWYQITSGAVTGYVNANYVVTGIEAESYANELVPTTATVTVDGLRIRSEADSEASIVTTAYNGEVLRVVNMASAPDGWVAVEDGYVVAEYVTVSQDFTTAITVEEREAEIAAKEAAEAAAAAELQAQQEAAAAAVNQAAAITASADEVTLLAALIQCEGGNQPYEGQVAIGSVVMNRVRSPRWPNSISEVIFQSGQFYPASSTKLAGVISAGPKASCMQAAQDAINGLDMVGGCMSFRPVSSGRAGIVIGGHVFF